MTSPILVTGGTGTLGRCVVPRLRAAGADVRILSRSGHAPAAGIEYVTGDLATGVGVERAVDGVETIVHCAGSARGDEVKARNLVPAASRAGVRHIVNISVVGAERVPVVSGIDRMMFGYFAMKRATEEVISDSGIPWTTLRATQFHDLILIVVRQLAKLPLTPVPTGTRFQPVDTDEVAERMVEAALDNPAGLLPEFGGPRAYTIVELLQAYLQAEHRGSRPKIPLRMPGKAARAIREGANLTLAHADGRVTWEQFLTEQVRKGQA